MESLLKECKVSDTRVQKMYPLLDKPVHSLRASRTVCGLVRLSKACG